MTKTQISPNGLFPPVFGGLQAAFGDGLSGDALYDHLMSQIEPELMIMSLPGLTEKYKNETPTEKIARGEKYDAAFAKYETALATYLGGAIERAHTYRAKALASLEQEDRAIEETDLQQIESAFSKS